MILSQFRKSIEGENAFQNLQNGLIGEGAMIPGANGDVPMVYADYVASGRAMRQVEDFIVEKVLPFYANSHSESSYCGAYVTKLRHEARSEIARLTGADGEYSVIFAGSGATAGLNRLVTLLGVNAAARPVVFIGPYEHHSNILPWRESRATVIEIPEAAGGGPDLDVLRQALTDHADADLKIGSFSAASNVTGIVTDSTEVTRILKANGALAIWDFAGGGPYLPIDMGAGTDAQKDAVVVSPHKFPGGPGASGVLILRNNVVRTGRPSWPGGGTVAFVSPWTHDYLEDLVEREEAGTPNVVGDIRAALAFVIKDVIGAEVIAAREAHFNGLGKVGWAENSRLTLLGADCDHRLPIFSFLVRDGAGNLIHEQVFTRMLSDIYGIQARGGCACAGPYGHRLLEIDQEYSEILHQKVLGNKDFQKPGWVRLNFSYLMDESTVRYIIDSVNELTHTIKELAAEQRIDAVNAEFKKTPQAA